MVCLSLVLIGLALLVDLIQRDLLGLDQPQPEVQISLRDRLIEPAALKQPDELDSVTALMATVTVPAGLVYLQAGGLLAVEGAADVSASVGFETVVLDYLPGCDGLLYDRGGLHDSHALPRPSVRMLIRRAPVSSFPQKWNSVPYFAVMVCIAL